MRCKISHSIPFFLVLILLDCSQNANLGQRITCGIYGDPNAFWAKGIPLNKLGVNAIFVPSGSINKSMLERARKEGLKIYAEFATLNGKDYVEKHQEAWAVDEEGKRVKPASWFLGVCPSEPEFRKYRLTELKTLLREFHLDGIWMDYIHWHAQFEEPEPILPETCFCNYCLENFQSSTGISIPGSHASEKAVWILKNHETAWRDWRCSVIAGWARDIKKIIREESPGALLGIFHCPWEDEEFNGARKRILGLDYDSLRNIVDVFSPMVYHGRMGREPEWVKENIDWFCSRLDIREGKFPKVWPIVQAYNDPYIISAAEFEEVLRGGLTGPSEGIMMFTANSVAEDGEKIKVLKEIYSAINK